MSSVIVSYNIVPPFLSIWAGYAPIASKLEKMFPAVRKRFNFVHGGRGSGKSVNMGDFFIERSRQELCRILCCREIQKSIKQSVLELLEQRINDYGIRGEFDIVKNEITHKITGSKFIFAGLQEHTSESIKSYQGIKYCWIEEAHTVSEKSLKILVPTIRAEGSAFFFTYNRYLENDPVHAIKRREIKNESRTVVLHLKKKTYKWELAEGPDALEIYMNFDANPFFPDVLEKERIKEKENSPDSYLHIWEGRPVSQIANAVISRAELEEACHRTVKAEGDIVVGLDVARFGDDSSQMYMRKGLKIIKQQSYSKIDTQTLTNHVEEFVDYKKETKIHVDDSGIGGGVTDALRARGYRNVVAVLFNQVPKAPDKYDMAISEMWFEFRSLLADVEIPNDEALKEELTERKYSFDKRQRRSIEAKRDFKKRVGRSPDKADALLLCFYNVGGGIIIEDFSSNEIGHIYEPGEDWNR